MVPMENQRVVRTFVAVLLDEELRRRISEVQQRVRKLAPDVRWVAPDNFHVTLKFLGGVRQERIAHIQDAMDEVVDGFSAFDLSLVGAGAFPNPRKPRVVWIGVEEGREQLIALANAVEHRLVDVGFEKEDKPFKSHITIGRVRDGKRAPDLTGALVGFDASEIGRQRIDSIAVMESVLKPEGPEYTPLSVHKLG